ncbi:hypothetical protein HO173_001614 [Letharia columbiana]|uniref:Secreted protein n=1 Tax=Letharia columbiana TaxID=112416 RepID=A0A8H6G3U5_9LECA|nr:uncharacterized protein HO173_001614 [Letharia columbiana]KAF6240006.1 hypothetical protein HO173_001614 [Letharia columbiana]
MMPSTLLTAATDIFVIAGAAAVAAAALNPKKAPFRTSLGTEHDDDSLIAAETNDAVSTPEQQQSPLEKHADDDKKAPTVTISEVAVTPVAEMQGGDFFACAKAA